MSGDQVLALKWRPDSFETLVGQDHAVRALSHALDNQRLHHAYLFTGTRGVGKTTIGRILAKCLNCEKGITSQPCNNCRSCREIASGRFIDLIEVDAASRTKVEDTRELLENVQYAPTSGRFKVYLIDEVHMLSTHSFNALLKTLEEPPPHVKFFLATTDPQKLPITVISRCLQFHLKCLPTEQIEERLAAILNEEKINFELPALTRIAQAGEGSMRDALSLLDQAIAFSNSNITLDHIKTMLSTIEPTYLYRILEALISTATDSPDASSLINIVTELAEQAMDFNRVLEELLSLLHQIAMTQFAPEITSTWDKEKVSQLAKQISPQDIQLFYQIGLTGRKDLPLAPTPRIGLEMVLLRMLAFKPGTKLESPNSKMPAETISQPKPPTEPTSDWQKIIQNLNLTGITAVIANNCTLVSIKQDEIVLAIDPAQAVILNKKQEERLQEALQTYFNRPLRLKIETGQPNMATPAAKDLEDQSKRKIQATAAIQQDPNVQKIIETFDATLLLDSVDDV